MSRPALPARRYELRLAAARAAAAEAGIGALLVGVGADLRYLTGYAAMESERLTMLVVPADGPSHLLAPRLEAILARECPAAVGGSVEVVAWDETDDPLAVVVGMIGAASSPAGPGRVAASDRLWASFLLGFQARMPDVAFGLASAVMTDLRIRKDEDEITLLRAAAAAADRVIAALAAGPLVGRTEIDVAREIRERLVAEGHEQAEFAIVAAGANAASPHHEPGDRVIGAGEPIVLDIGGRLGGYGSDITRTIWVTGGDAALGPDDAFRRVHALVLEAQQAATASVRPGIGCERLDSIARDIIDAGGYGDRFIHRLGHGIGLEGHEPPYLVGGSRDRLEPGMAFSIEPGIYLDGRYGVRIEDIVVCGEEGALVLNDAPRDLLVVEG